MKHSDKFVALVYLLMAVVIAFSEPGNHKILAAASIVTCLIGGAVFLTEYEQLTDCNSAQTEHMELQMPVWEDSDILSELSHLRSSEDR